MNDKDIFSGFVKTIEVREFTTFAGDKKKFKEPVLIDIFRESNIDGTMYIADLSDTLDLVQYASNEKEIEELIYKQFSIFWDQIIEPSDTYELNGHVEKIREDFINLIDKD